MSRNVIIALAIGVLVVGGLGYVTYKGNVIRPRPVAPPYVGAGGSPYNPNGPPLSAAGKIGQTFQDINSVVQGGTDLILGGKKAWDALTTSDSEISSDYVDTLSDY